MSAVEDRLRAGGVELPPPLAPLSAHVPIVVSRGIVFVSGHGPLDADRKPVFAGPVGGERSEAEGFAAARLSILNVLASLKQEFGDLDRIARVIRLTGYVLSVPGFSRQPWITDGASDLLVEAFGPERGQHARTSVGVVVSALNMTVTVDTVFELADADAVA
jgi:enamine deaminase RidA (YjgF/YER057c/UK114 family)